jgi:hypothetical protein
VLDRFLELLMRPRIRRVRRWSFLVTLPVAVLFVGFVGLESGAVVVGVRFVLWLAVMIAAWRVRGERGEALRDLLMHPRARALMRTALDVVLTLPRLLLRGPAAPGLRYVHGDYGFALALAFVPPLLAEAAVVHLLVPAGWIAVHVVNAVLHLYALVWLAAWGLGSRAYPHRVRRGVLVARQGPLYRAAVPLRDVLRVTVARERAPVVAERDGTVLLSARGRVDLWLELARPVAVRRPLADPWWVSRLGIASDDPHELAALLSRAASGAEEISGVLALAGGAELAYEALG